MFKVNETLFKSYIEAFNKDGESALKAICGCVVPTQVVLYYYRKLLPIETLPEKEKRDLWEYANELFPDKSTEEKIIVSKIVYCIGSYIT